MAYNSSKGLISIATAYSNGSYTWHKLDGFMQPGGIDITPDQMQDRDSTVNSKGTLIRKVLPVSRTKCECTTRNLSYDEKKTLLGYIASAIDLNDVDFYNRTSTPIKCNKDERCCVIRYYNDYTDSYHKAHMYIPDITFKFGGTYEGKPRYLPMSIHMVAYEKAINE